MNVGAAHAHDSQFGPPSEPIDVSEFLKTLETSRASPSDAATFQRTHWDILPEAEREAIQAECRCADSLVLSTFPDDLMTSVADLQGSLNAVLDDPKLAGHIIRTHRSAASAIHHTADLTAGKSKKGARSGRAFVPDPAEESLEVIRLRDELDAVKLKAWP